MNPAAPTPVPYNRQLTPRALVIGALGAVIISASSMYVALRLGALPWPTVFVALLSMAALRALGNTNLNEINVTHTAMSAGAMIAGGFAFTIPAIWILQPDTQIEFVPLILVILAGTILGLILTAIVRRHFIETESLPYPVGTAAYETVQVGDEGGGKAGILFGSMGISAAFVAARDLIAAVPGAITSARLARRNIFVGFWLAPIALGIGYIIDIVYTAVWFAGSLFAFLILVPVGISTGIFPDLAAADAFRSSLGIGLMVGTGVGVLVKGIIPRLATIFAGVTADLGRGDAENRRLAISLPVGAAVLAFLLSIFAGIPTLPAVLLLLGVAIATIMAADLTGQTGINPMEILGIIVLLGIRLIVPDLGQTPAILIAAVTAVSCGLTGDVLNDFKAGHLLGTSPRAQITAEALGGVIGALVSVGTFAVLLTRYGTFGGELPAPQAHAVAALAAGIPDVTAFATGAAVGLLIYLLRLPGMTLGLGVYLPMMISAPVFLGGLIRLIVRRVRPAWDEKGVVAASGFLGGEGVTGVVIAIIQVSRGLL
ncbi:MAG: OPT/YSL family transporter [Alkalispirochaeta sp.]